MNNPDPAARKDELAAQVAGAMACSCEEFYNTCHGKGGLFCETGGKGGGGGKGGKTSGKKVSGKVIIDNKSLTERAARNIGVRVAQTKKDLAQRNASPDLKRTTTGLSETVAKAVISATIPLVGGGRTMVMTPKLLTLENTDISKFSTADLKFVHKRLVRDQSLMKTSLMINALQYDPIGIAYTAWRAKRTPAQIERFESELTKRHATPKDSGQGLALEEISTLAVKERFPTLAEEIIIAKKRIADGDLPEETKLSAPEIEDLRLWLKGFPKDDEAGLTTAMVKSMRDSLDKYIATH